MKNETTCILAIKTANGDDVLGFYSGETAVGLDNEPAIMLFRPIRIRVVSGIRNGKIYYNYLPEFYFPFGETITPIAYSSIVHQEIANHFFARLYEKVLGELMSFEEQSHAEITSLFDKDDLDLAMEGTDSMYTPTASEYIQ